MTDTKDIICDALIESSIDPDFAVEATHGILAALAAAGLVIVPRVAEHGYYGGFPTGETE